MAVATSRTAWAAARHGKLAGEGGSGIPWVDLGCDLCPNEEGSLGNLTQNSAKDENGRW
jgi:hypothetical protein